MSFQVIYQEILEKVIDSTEKLYNEELLKKVHSYTNDYKWDFDKDGEVITVERANAEKEKGTKFFRNNQLQEACDAYTSFFKLAHRVKDVDEKERQKMLYQGYSNRSAVFFRAQKHLFCLDDIDAALHFSPDPKADYMIYDRRARCYLFTKLWAKAREAFNDALLVRNLSTSFPSFQMQLIGFLFAGRGKCAQHQCRLEGRFHRSSGNARSQNSY